MGVGFALVFIPLHARRLSALSMRPFARLYRRCKGSPGGPGGAATPRLLDMAVSAVALLLQLTLLVLWLIMAMSYRTSIS